MSRLIITALTCILWFIPFKVYALSEIILYLNDGQQIPIELDEDLTMEVQNETLLIGNQDFLIPDISKYIIETTLNSNVYEIIDENDKIIFTKEKEIRLSSSVHIDSIKIFDVQGREMPVNITNQGLKKIISLKNLTKGVYVMAYSKKSFKFYIQ